MPALMIIYNWRKEAVRGFRLLVVLRLDCSTTRCSTAKKCSETGRFLIFIVIVCQLVVIRVFFVDNALEIFFEIVQISSKIVFDFALADFLILSENPNAL